MDNIRSKLKINSFIQNAIVISNLTDSLKCKSREENPNFDKTAEVRCFKTLIVDDDLSISSTACDNIVEFVKTGILELSDCLIWLMSSLPISKNPHIIVKSVSDLLYHSLNPIADNKQSYICPYSVFSVPHPFIRILKHDKTLWYDIEHHMKSWFNSADSKMKNNVFELLRPVFKYILWIPSDLVDVNIKRSAWKLLFNNRSLDKDLHFIVQTLCWLPTNKKLQLLNGVEYASDLHGAIQDKEMGPIICLFCLEIASGLAKSGYEPTSVLQLIEYYVKRFPEMTDIILVGISLIMTECPINFVNKFIHICIKITGISKCNSIALWMVVGATLPWLLHPIPQLKSVHDSAEKLMRIAEKADHGKKFIQKNSYDRFMKMCNSNSNLFEAVLLVRTLQKLSNRAEVDSWLDGLDFEKNEIQKFRFVNTYLSAIALGYNDADIQVKVLNVLMSANPGEQFPLIMYMLSKPNSHPKLQLKLLQSIPLTADNEENIPTVLKIIGLLKDSKKHILSTLAVQLYLALWKVEERCFSYLLSQLTVNNAKADDASWEISVIQTAAMKDICSIKPNLHGKELLSFLSNTLKNCTKPSGALPSSLALEAILQLYQADVLDIVIIYEGLAKRLLNDKRSLVICKLCDLMGVMFEKLDRVNGIGYVENEAVMCEVLTKLWQLTSHENVEILKACFNALSKCSIDQVSFKTLPEEYRNKVKVPSQYIKTPIDASKKPDELLSFIPGSAWITILKQLSKNAATEFVVTLRTWLAKEVKNYPKALCVSMPKEPTEFKNLPHKSIYRAMVEYLVKFMKNRNEKSEEQENPEICIYVLKVLNYKYPKPFPVFDWTFAKPLIGTSNMEHKREFFGFLAKQTVISNSAKIIVEDYINNFNITINGESELEMVINAIPDMCINVSFGILRPFLASSAKYIFKKRHSCVEDEIVFKKLCFAYESALKEQNIEENNRTTIAQLVESMWEQIPENDKLLPDLLRVTYELPNTFLDHIATPSVMWEMNSEKLRKSIILRCRHAMQPNQDNPLVWLNECIEVISTNFLEQDVFYENASRVLKSNRLHASKWSWLSELMGKIHEVSSSEASTAELNGVVDAFVFSIVCLSIYGQFLDDDSLLHHYRLFFPQALFSLITTEVLAQVIGWLHYMNNSKKIDAMFVHLFYDAIVALRHFEHSINEVMWMKIVT